MCKSQGLLSYCLKGLGHLFRTLAPVRGRRRRSHCSVRFLKTIRLLQSFNHWIKGGAFCLQVARQHCQRGDSNSRGAGCEGAWRAPCGSRWPYAGDSPVLLVLFVACLLLWFLTCPLQIHSSKSDGHLPPPALSCWRWVLPACPDALGVNRYLVCWGWGADCVVCCGQCAAAEAGIQKYQDEVANAWPWVPAARSASVSSQGSSEVRPLCCSC